MISVVYPLCDQDIFLLGLRPLSDKLMNQLLSHLVLPVLVGSLVDVDDLVQKQQDILDNYEREMDAIDDAQQQLNERNHQNNVISENTTSNKPLVTNSNPNSHPNSELSDVNQLQTDKGNLTRAKSDSSSIAAADDDTQKASAIRKFLERRTRISKQLALFLLTQVLTVFSDGGLINAVIVALMHPHPPKLVNQIVLQPPQKAVESSKPVAQVICIKRAYYSSAPSTPANESVDYDLNIEEKEADNHHDSILQAVLDRDENIGRYRQKRIESVEKMDVIHEDSTLPEESNMFRNELLGMLDADPTQTENEQLIASAAALILTIIRV